MEANEQGFFKKNKTIISFIGGFVLGFIICYTTIGKQPETIKVTIPEISSKSDTIVKFEPYKVITHKDSIVFKDSIIHSENPFNKELAQNYIDLDKRFIGMELEKKRLEEYVKSIETNDYKIPFEDKSISITNNIKTQGKLLSFQQDYTIKERVVETKIDLKKSSLNFFVGGEISNNKNFNDFSAKANLFIQIPKGDLINVSYGTDQKISIGYAFKF